MKVSYPLQIQNSPGGDISHQDVLADEGGWGWGLGERRQPKTFSRLQTAPHSPLPPSVSFFQFLNF